MSNPQQPAGETEMPQPMVEALMMSANMLRHLVPALSEEQALQLVAQAFQEQEQLLVMIQDGAGPAAQQHGAWGLLLKDSMNGQINMVAPKLVHATDPESTVQSINVLAMITSPLARAVARASGYELRFAQSVHKPKSKIIL